jgi:hypothetical protein
MNDKNFTNILRIAAHALDNPKVPREFQDALLARAPLSSLIDSLLVHQPKCSMRSALERIADLNQGTVGDLNAPAFQSYVIYNASVNEFELYACMREIETFRQLSETVASKEYRHLCLARIAG